MAEENSVTMTVENVDQLFSEIVVNGESHVSDRYVPPEPRVNITPVTQEETPQEVNTPSAQETQGEDVYSVELNDVLHDFVDRAVTQGLADEIQNRQNADTALQGSINNINDKIPAQASSSNQLADKNFVNSSISTNTANFIGTFESVTDLQSYSGTVTNNDYAFVVNEVIQYNGSDFPDVTTLNNYDKTTLTNGDYAWVVNSEDNTKYDLYRFDIVEQSWVLRNTKIDKSQDVLNSFYNRYKATVSGSTVTWLYEYTLNNSSFTAEQWATINSGITGVSDTVASGDENPVTSDAVYQALQTIDGADIEVYPTLADAEADLANLDVGQFIATEQGGDGITDAVTDGDMRAVTSNAVADSLSYSTTETLTGGTWIDGKPIYRQIVTSTNNVQTTSSEYRNTGAPLPTFETMIQCRYISDLATLIYYSNASGSTIKIAGLQTVNVYAGAKFLLEYTKP